MRSILLMAEPRMMARIASAVAASAVLAARTFAATPLPHSQLTYYGAWNDSDIATFQRFDLLVLQPGMYGTGDNEPQAIAKLKAKGTKVLLYVTMGEDDRTYNNAPPVKGDGRGPARFDVKSNSIVYENKGVASFYLDEWNINGYDSDPVNKVPDGIPDRQGDWGACLVNAGDAEWQNEVMATVKSLMDEGADGLFLDTPETADPWHGYGWTAQGMFELIQKIRNAYPNAYLLLNRGLFFFEPNFPYQYQWSPRKLVNAVMFESYYSDSDYPVADGGNGSWKLNPYFLLNKYTTAPRLNAEMGRSGNFGSILSLDYANDPINIVKLDTAYFNAAIRETEISQGWLPEIIDRTLVQIPTSALDFPPPTDRAAPQWQNTAVGFSDLIQPTPPFFMAPGDDRGEDELRALNPKPRTGLLKAIPGNGKVTLRWDVAADQTRPVRYNVYYSKGPFDFATAVRLSDVKTNESADYTLRGYTDADDACPYEFTVSGLDNNALYRFAVRAEDATSGVSALSSGHAGPNGGIEEDNAEVLAAIPRDSSAHAITIDGSAADWAGIPAIPDSAGDGSGIDFRSLRITDDTLYLYLYLETAAAADPAKTVLLFNSDRLSYTGDTSRAGSGFRGADYRWRNGALERFDNGAWAATNAATTYKAAGTGLEIRINKRDMGGDKGAGLNAIAVSADGKETLPDHGVVGFSYTYTHPIDKTAGIRSAAGRAPAPSLSLETLGGNAVLRFANPHGSAELSVADIRGRVLARSHASGTEAVLPLQSMPRGLWIVSVRAQGMAPVQRALMVP